MTKLKSGGAILLVGVLLLCCLHCDRTTEQRRASVYELSNDPTEENLRQLRDMLSDPDRDVRATALNALVGLEPPDAEQRVLAALDDEDGFVRSIAAKLAGDLGLHEQVPLLVTKLLEDPDPWVRQRSAQTLETLGGDAAAAGLAQGLDDPLKQVRLAAVTGIRQLDPGRAKQALARLLLEASEWEVRAQAAGALGRTGDPEMIPVLEAALEDESPFVRRAAANALDPTAIAGERAVAPPLKTVNLPSEGER